MAGFAGFRVFSPHESITLRCPRFVQKDMRKYLTKLIIFIYIETSRVPMIFHPPVLQGARLGNINENRYPSPRTGFFCEEVDIQKRLTSHRFVL